MVFFPLYSFIRSAFGFIEEHLTEVKICGAFSRAHIARKKCGCSLETKLSNRIVDVFCAYRPMADLSLSLSLVLPLFLPLLDFILILSIHFILLQRHHHHHPGGRAQKEKSVFERVNLGIHRKIVTISRFIHKNTQSYLYNV